MPHPFILLNGEQYRLMRKGAVPPFANLTARSWEVERSPIATTIELPPNVHAVSESEFTLTENTWHRGIWGDRDAPPGCPHYCDNIEARYPGRLFHAGAIVQTLISAASLPFGADPIAIIEQAGTVLIAAGRYMLKYSNGAWVSDEDLGATAIATDAELYQDNLVVALGTGNYIQSRDSSGTFTLSTDTKVKKLTRVRNKLWRGDESDKISVCQPEGNPLTLVSWSTPEYVGDPGTAITGMADIGVRLAVAKEEGLFLGDERFEFPNVLPDIAAISDPENGKELYIRGAELFYPYVRGLKWYLNGMAAEIGPNLNYQSHANEAQVIGLHPTALTSDGEYIYAAMEPAFFEKADPGGFLKTVDSGANYTSYTAAVGDNANSTTAVLNDLNTVANDDWVVVGASAQFYGIQLFVKNPNTNASVMTVEYWNGSAWAAMNAAAGDSSRSNVAADYTAVGGKSLSKSQNILWRTLPTDWATSTLKTLTLYWIRLSFSAALSAIVDISEARILKNAPACAILAGKLVGERWIWHCLCMLAAPRITTLGLSNNIDGNIGRCLIAGGLQVVYHKFLDLFPSDVSPIVDTTARLLHSPRIDAGLPFLNKEWINCTIKGKTLNSNQSVTLACRTDENPSWTTWGAAVTSSPTTATPTSRPTGRMLQYRLTFTTAVAADQPTEANLLEFRFRVLPTYKKSYTFLLELNPEGQTPSPNVQLTNLAALIGTAAVDLIDPLGTAVTVSVVSVGDAELIQEGVEYPSLVVRLVAVEI